MNTQAVKSGRCPRFLLSIFILAVVSTGIGTAQTPGTQEFELKDLSRLPGDVYVSTDFTTIIEFEGYTIEANNTARQDLYISEPTGNRIVLRANKDSIRTDLVVTVAGQTALFRIISDPQADAPRRYLVRDTPTQRRSFQTFGGAKGRPRPPENGADIPLFPLGLLFEGKVIQPSQTDIIVQYTLTNESEHAIVIDPNRLHIYYGDSSVSHELERIPALGNPLQLSPGEVEAGQINIPKAPTVENLDLVWTLIELGPGTQHVLERNLGELAAFNEISPLARVPDPASPAETTEAQATEAQATVRDIAESYIPKTDVAADATPKPVEPASSVSIDGELEDVLEFDTPSLELESDINQTEVDNEGVSLVDATFEMVTAADWTFHMSEEANATQEVVAGESCIKVIDGGPEFWDIRFAYPGLNLKNGNRYRLRFDAYADKPTAIAHELAMNVEPWRSYIWRRQDLSTTKTSFEEEFKLEKAGDESSRLVFHVGRFEDANEGTYQACFDNIELVDLGPGQSADTALMQANDMSEELMSEFRSDFETGADEAWKLWMNEDLAQASGAFSGGEYCVTVERGGQKIWHVGFMQEDLLFSKGKTYTLGFDAYADKPAVIFAGAIRQVKPYVKYLEEKVTLPSTKRRFDYTFQASEEEPQGRVVFHLGGEFNAQLLPYRICLDNIELAQTSY